MTSVTIGVPDLGPAWSGLESDYAAIVTTAMRGATEGALKGGLRDQVRAAGLGNRLANTWRADSYPKSGNALEPAGYAWSNAPDIIDAFTRGATIVPRNGKNYLWIPTRRVPRASGRSGKRMTPEQLLASLGIDEFVIKRGRGGRLLAYAVEGRGRTKRDKLRRVRKGRLAHGGEGQLVLMYTLVRSVTLPGSLDPIDVANHAAADFVARVNQGVR